MKSLFLHNSGKYYFRIWIPLDLRNIFLPFIGSRPDFAFSLKTSDHLQAQILALQFSQKSLTTFSLLRTNALSAELITSLICDLVPQKKKPNRTAKITSNSLPSKTLSQIWNLYRDEHGTGWTSKSKIEFDGQFKTILFVLSDLPVNHLDRTGCVKLRDALLNHVPPNYAKKKEYRNLSYFQLAELGQGGLHPKTVNKHLSLLSSIFKWAVRHSHTTTNPAEGLTIAKTQRADEERKAYSVDDIQKIINNLRTGPKPAWIPIIAMYSGARREEICSLVPADIKLIDEIWCFDINEQNDRHIKTEAGKRIVPVHPKLIELGLLQIIKEQPNKTNNLWNLPNWRGNYGKTYGNLFGKWNRKYITDDPKKVFHSFRHTVTDTLKQAGVSESVIAEIVGHENDNITTGRYGKRYKPALMLEALKSLDYRVNFDAAVPLLRIN